MNNIQNGPFNKTWEREEEMLIEWVKYEMVISSWSEKGSRVCWDVMNIFELNLRLGVKSLAHWCGGNLSVIRAIFSVHECCDEIANEFKPKSRNYLCLSTYLLITPYRSKSFDASCVFVFSGGSRTSLTLMVCNFRVAFYLVLSAHTLLLLLKGRFTGYYRLWTENTW